MYPQTISVVLGGDNQTNVRMSAVFFSTTGGTVGVAPVHIASTVEGHVKFFLPFCFDLSEEESIGFPPGHNPLEGQPFFNCTNDQPPAGYPTVTVQFTPEMTQTVPTTVAVTATRPATLTAHATKTSHSRSGTRSPTATRGVTPARTPSATVAVTALLATPTPQPTVTVEPTPTPTPEATKSKGWPVRDILGLAIGVILAVLLIVVIVWLGRKLYKMRTNRYHTLDTTVLVAQQEQPETLQPLVSSTG
jgi:hypothetical protein